MKTIIFLATALCLALGCTADHGDTYDRIANSGILRLGTDATYPPFEFNDEKTGRLIGFDIDLINAICRELNLKPEFTVVPFSGIIGGLNSGKYDCIISAMTITEDRQQAVSFSRPYYKAGQAIAVPINDTTITGIADLKGKKIGVQLGTTGEMKAKEIEDAQVISFDNIGAAFIDMENGRLDAVLNDYPTSMRVIAVRGNAKIVGTLLSEENYGIAVRKSDSELLDSLNSALGRLMERNFIDSLNAYWIGG